MFHRPFATVLSSVSIRSLVSTRLFCAPAASVNDEITTVQTTGIRYTENGLNRAEFGVYWGKDDSRNIKMERNYGKMSFPGVRMRSIMMALEEAKKDGLKRIRVQNDSDMDEMSIRRMAHEFKEMSLLPVREQELPKLAYCERIAKIMDEMEVILVKNENSEINEVIELLDKEDKTHNPDSIAFGHKIPFYDNGSNDKLQQKVEAVPFSGSTVRTTGFVTKKNGSRISTIGIYWGDGDLRNVKIVSQFVISGAVGLKMRSIMMALDQAQKGGMKRVRVQTDYVDELRIREAAQMFKTSDLTPLKEHEISTFVYCEKIVKVLDEMEVILENRSSWLDHSEKRNEVLTMLKRDLLNRVECAPDRTVTPNGVDSLEGRTVPTVYVVGRLHKADELGMKASIWIPETIDHLEISQRPVGSIEKLSMHILTPFRAELKAIIAVITEARDLNLPEIQVVTNSNKFVESFKRGWRTPDGSTVANENLYLEIKELSNNIKIHFKAVRPTGNCDDELMKKVYESAKVPETHVNSDSIHSTSTDLNYGLIITPSGVSPLEGRIVPTVYVSGSISNEQGMFTYLWEHESIDNLEKNKRPVGTKRRLNLPYCSLFRCQLVGILDAIQMAHNLGLPEIVVITDSLHFVQYFPNSWKNHDGSSFAYEQLYLRIKALTETTKVHFKGVRLSEESDDGLMKKVYHMAKMPEDESNRSPNCFY